MAINRQKKEQTLADLEKHLEHAKSIIFADYRGTTVKKINELRRDLRKDKVYAKIAKITLIKKVLAKHGIDTSGMDFKVPIAVMASEEDEVLPAKVLANFMKENKNVRICMGVMDKNILSAQQVMSLALLPGKKELRGKLVSGIAAPVSGFVNVLAASIRSLFNVLNAIKEVKS